MIFKKLGLSIIEYSLLAMLVIVGTIVMGPYFIRSIGAHFQLWQESIDDSIDDRMVKSKGVTIPTVCQCGPLVTGACGGHFQTSSFSCPVDSRYQYTPCSPPGCGFTSPGFQETCLLDTATCCSTYRTCFSYYAPSNPSCCGKISLNDPACLNRPAGVQLNNVSNPGTAPYNYSDYCCYNEVALINNCYQSPGQTAPPIPSGLSINNFIKCERIPSGCQPICTGTPHSNTKRLFPGGPSICPIGVLTQDRPWTVVTGNSCLPAGDACREICDVGYQIVGSGAGAYCAAPTYQIATVVSLSPPNPEMTVNTPHPQPQGPWCFSGTITSITSPGIGCYLGFTGSGGASGIPVSSPSGASPGQNCSVVIN